jgi:hypothetical protein
MKTMSGFEKWQVIVIVIQSGIFLMTFIAALYFGLKQKEVNETLAQIESYNHEQIKIQQDNKIIQETRDLRNIASKIMSFFIWGTSKEKEAINNRTHEDNLIIAKVIKALLDDGIDNDLLKSNKNALHEWLNACDQISGLIQNSTEFYNLEKEGGVKEIAGPISADAFEEWKESNKQWTITSLSQEEVEAHNTKELQKVFQSIAKVYEELDLSFTQLKTKLEEELGPDSENK